MNLLRIALVGAISLVIGLVMTLVTGCEAGQEVGRVADRDTFWHCRLIGKAPVCGDKYRLWIQLPTDQRVAVTLEHSEWKRCPVGSAYPKCRTAGRAAA